MTIRPALTPDAPPAPAPPKPAPRPAPAPAPAPVPAPDPFAPDWPERRTPPQPKAAWA